MKNYDLIIIGCGGIGSAALYSAVRAGLKTLCIEQYEQNHNRGGTHGETRAFRKVYYENPLYTPLLHQAYLDWKKLNQQANKILFVENGVLEMCFPNSSVALAAIDSAKKYRIPLEVLSSQEIEQRFPGFRVPEGMIGIFQPEAGFLYVDDCLNYFIDHSRSAGANILFNEKVLAWQVTNDHLIQIKTNKNTYQSKFLIVTAGSWASEIFPELNLPLNIVQKKLFWASTVDDTYSLNHSPCFAYHLLQGKFYGFPSISGYVKIARHDGGLSLANPEENAIAVNKVEIDSIKKFASEYLTKISLENTKEKNCLYDNTPDMNFIIDVHPKHSQIAFATGLSGHGYKMSNVLGDILVNLIIKRENPFDLSFLSLN